MFTKKDLKNGMVVETRDYLRYMVVGDRLIGYDGFLILADYGPDLCDLGDELYKMEEGLSPYDIMRVFDVVSDLNITEIAGTPLFERRAMKESSKNNENRARTVVKEFSNIYGLDENKLYNRFLKILYDISCTTIPTISINDFDIEKCAETLINNAICELGKDCLNYSLIKTTEKD